VFVADVLVGLADAIEALRDELMVAIMRSKDKPMRFALEPIELAVQAVVTKDANGKIGWNILGVGGKYETARTQTVTLKLSPLWQKTDGTLTSDFAIASVGAGGDTVGPHD
jgi:Trypsin-co-occurring domain 2